MDGRDLQETSAGPRRRGVVRSSGARRAERPVRAVARRQVPLRLDAPRDPPLVAPRLAGSAPLRRHVGLAEHEEDWFVLLEVAAVHVQLWPYTVMAVYSYGRIQLWPYIVMAQHSYGLL